MKTIEAILSTIFLFGGFTFASIVGIKDNKTNYEYALMCGGFASMVIGGGKIGRDFIEEEKPYSDPKGELSDSKNNSDYSN